MSVSDWTDYVVADTYGDTYGDDYGDAPPLPEFAELSLTSPIMRDREDVRQLQVAVGAAVDGAFGEATDRAVRSWQAEHGFEPDGRITAAHWPALAGTAARRAARVAEFARTGA